MRVGLIGENPNDTDTIANLLKMQFNHQYISVLKRRKGNQLDNIKFSKLLEVELKLNRFDVLIFIRDLDGFEHEVDKVKVREDWFEKNKAYFKGDSLFLLNVHALEAIFFADVESMNTFYNLSLKFKNPLFINKPKDELKRLTAEKYHENKAADLISKLNYGAVLKNYKPLEEIHNYFTQ
jgi:hypothetical protein